MVKTFKKFTHCGDTYYVGVESPAHPRCGECGETIDEVEAVEVYDTNIKHGSKPVEKYSNVEQWKEENEH